jgi:hypothetical protein
MKAFVATLARARLGAILLRSSSEKSEQVESRRSPGMKKCLSWSRYGVDAADVGVEAGSAGTGGTSRCGESGGDRFITPGIYAIWMTLDARV